MIKTIAIDYRMSRASGIGVYLRNIVRRLLDDYQAEFRLVLIGGDPVPGAEHRPCNAPIYSVAELVAVPLSIPRSADILWSPNYNAPMLSRGRLVVTVHDVNHLALPQFLDSPLKRRYARLMFANVKRRAAHVICASNFTATELTRFIGLAPDRMTVVYCGISDSWRHPSVAPRPIAGPYILFVGNVKPHKNLSRLLNAFARLAGRIPQTLVIVGKRDGFITPDREVIAVAEKLGSRVVFSGQVSDEMVRAYYAHADLLVHPSIYEGFGFSPLEAMATGIPVAASSAASTPEICGDAAAYFDPYSIENMSAVIESALTNQSLRARLIEAGKRQSAKYSWDTATAQIAAVFRQVAAS